VIPREGVESKRDIGTVQLLDKCVIPREGVERYQLLRISVTLDCML